MKKFILALILVLTLPISGFGANYYVDSNAAGGGDGTIETPWNTLAAAQAALTGDQSDNFLFLAKDSLFRETFTFGASGTSGHPFTLSAYGSGNLPKIYGSTEVSTWSDIGGNLWTATSASDPESLWFVNTDDSIVWGEDMGAVTPSSEYQWKYSGTTVTVYATSDPDTRYTTVEKATRLNGVDISRENYVTISYLDISFCGGVDSSTASAIYQDGGANPGTNGVIVEYNTIHHIGKMSLSSSSSHQGNGVDLSNTSNSFIRYNDISYCGRRGIVLWVNNASRVLDDTTIEGNIVYNNNHAQMDCFWQNAGGTFDNIIIRYNYFYTDSNVGQGATLKAEIHGINLESNSGEKMTNFKILSNIISGMVGSASIYVRGTDGLVIYNNTIYSDRLDNGYLYGILINNNKAAGNSNVTLKNNIVYLVGGTDGALNVTDKDYITACENNLWYNTGGQPFTVVESIEYDSSEQAAYKSATTWDDDGLWEDPVFTTNGSDFTLQSTSPCIDAGEDLGDTYDDGLDPDSTWPDGVTTLDQDLFGAGWDIGAYVYNLFISDPSPTTAGTGINTDLNWTNPTGTVTVDVYFEEVSGACDLQVGDLVVDDGDVATYDPGTMSEATAHCWRVDVNHAGGTETGVVYAFTTTTGPPAPPAGLAVGVYNASGLTGVYDDQGATVGE